MQLDIEVVNTFGTFRGVPLNDEAKKLCELMKQKSFSIEDIERLSALGMSLNVKISERIATQVADRIHALQQK